MTRGARERAYIFIVSSRAVAAANEAGQHTAEALHAHTHVQSARRGAACKGLHACWQVLGSPDRGRGVWLACITTARLMTPGGGTGAPHIRAAA
jgi:hypothetical protein